MPAERAAEASPGLFADRARAWRILVAVTVLAMASSGAVCYAAYYLIGIPLFPPGAVGRVLQLAPLLTPMLVCPSVALPQIRAGERQAALLAEVQSTRLALQTEVAERKATQARLEDLARRDPLTGLLNRRGFFESWAAETAPDDSVLVTVDLDHFKAINDAYGHAAGDEVLRKTADTLRTLAGEGACVARLGGDEFAVTMSAAGGSVARLRAGLSGLPVVVADGSTTLVSASVGAALLDAGITVDEVLAMADESMYAQKRERAAADLLDASYSLGAGSDNR